jgi:hypothetical protein
MYLTAIMKLMQREQHIEMSVPTLQLMQCISVVTICRLMSLRIKFVLRDNNHAEHWKVLFA